MSARRPIRIELKGPSFAHDSKKLRKDYYTIYNYFGVVNGRPAYLSEDTKHAVWYTGEEWFVSLSAETGSDFRAAFRSSNKDANYPTQVGPDGWKYNHTGSGYFKAPLTQFVEVSLKHHFVIGMQISI